MFISAFIFVISMAAVVQFLIQSWRSGLLQVARAPQNISADDPSAAVYRKLLETQDFNEVIGYQNVCQDLAGSDGRGLKSVEMYYSMLRGIRALVGQIGSEWFNQEMALCTRYAAVVMVQRLERNQALAAEVRSY
jgi:urease accessory protein UreF